MNNSEYIVYVDESGDHQLERKDPYYPVFVLTFCIFQIHDYLEFLKKFTEFKFNVFGHDLTIFHENEIRRDEGEFKFLNNESRKVRFMADIASMMNVHEFKVIRCIIDKNQHVLSHYKSENVYNLALQNCLEQLYSYFSSLKVHTKPTHIVLEGRGWEDNKEVVKKFKHYCNRNNIDKAIYKFKYRIVDKKVNSPGLQLADLIARPIGLSYHRSDQENRAYESIKNKILHGFGGNLTETGLYKFP